MLDARSLGELVDRTHRDLTDGDITTLAGTYHAWRGDKGSVPYADVAGLAKSVSLEEIRANKHIVSPGRFVGAAVGAADAEGFDSKVTRLAASLRRQQRISADLDRLISEQLDRMSK